MAKGEEILDTGRLGEIRKRLGANLPSDWVLTTLGEAFKWGSGGTPTRTNPRYYDGDIPWLIIGDLNDGVVSESDTMITEEGLRESSAKWVEPGSVLLAMYGSIGKLGIASRRLTTNQAIAFTKPDPVDTKYLFYYLMYTRGDLASLGKGATQKNISQTVIKAFPFVLAPQDQQKRIVAEIEKQFSRLDEAVANLKRVKANLKRYKAAVLKATVEGRLVETEAERTRREGRGYETGAQLLQRILETRRSQWQGKGKYKEPTAPDTTDLPELPEGWVWATADQLCTQITDGEHIQPRYQSIGFPMLTAKNVRDGYVAFGDVGYIAEEDFKACLKRCAPVEQDILVVSVGATTGRTAIVGACQPFALVRSVLLLRPEQNIASMYLLYWMQSPWCQTHIKRASGATAQAHLYIKDTRTIPVPVPPLEEQRRIVAEVDRRYSLQCKTEVQVDASLQRAERLRQSILSRAFSSFSNASGIPR